MSKPRIVLVILVDLLLLTALVLIYQIDQMINSTLYYFGLIFDIAWAQPYFLLSRLGAIGIIVAIILFSAAELPIPAFEEKDQHQNYLVNSLLLWLGHIDFFIRISFFARVTQDMITVGANAYHAVFSTAEIKHN
jgi:hypothetical protein